MTTINFPSEFKDIVINYNNKNFDQALKLLDEIPDNENFKLFKLKLYASIYFLTAKWDKSLFYHSKLLSKEEGTFEIFNNLAVTLFNIGKVTDAIEYFTKCIEMDDKVELIHQNLGVSFMHIGDYQRAVEYFIKTLNINNKNINSIALIIDLLNYVIPKSSKGNYLLELNTKILDFFEKKREPDIFKDTEIVSSINEVEERLEKENKVFSYNKTEIFRRNLVNLDCKRHFNVFNKFNVIPEYCFNCYKIQVNITDVFHLIKLLFLFNSNFLKNNNIRKCMVETRNKVKGNYKGFIYCSGLNEAKEVLQITRKKMKKYGIQYKIIEIKHGCTEFYNKYPNFKKINLNGSQEMVYDNSWKKFEKIIDSEKPVNNERIVKKSINKINLSDILIIKNWLNYAEIIGDQSFEKIYTTKRTNNFLTERLKNQINFRKEEL